jgi:hypothetical protein
MGSILGKLNPQAQPLFFACAKCREMTNASLANRPYCDARQNDLTLQSQAGKCREAR